MSQLHGGMGYIINIYDLSDTSQIVHFFLAENGIVKAVAKGAKSPKSAFAASLDLFNAVEISYQHARGSSDLHTLKEIKVQNRLEGARGSYPRLLVASYFSALVDYWLESEQDSGPVFDLFSRALGYVNDGELSWKGVTYFEQELSRLLGYSNRAEEVRKLYQSSNRLNKLRDQVEKAWRNK